MADHDHGEKNRSVNPLDLNGPNFDCEAYFVKKLKEEDLEELIKTDHQLTQEVRSLDQEMQTLVYENYNKFITATDTIRKMNQDFVLMEEEMSRLAESMSRITDFSKQVGDNLKGRRQDVQRLAKASGTLKQLESVINLPQTLQNHVQQQKDYVGAVKAYLKARPILERLKDEPALRSIYSECAAAIAEAKDQLKDAFRSRTSTNKELATNVSLLLQLNERPEDVAEEFIRTANERLHAELDALENSVAASLGQTDIVPIVNPAAADFTTSGGASGDVLEFVDSECSHFLGDLCLMVNSGRELFPRLADVMMEAPVDVLMARFLSCVERRFCAEPDPIGEGELLVRALDRFYRRVHAANQVLAVGGDRYEALAKELTSRVAMRRVEATADQLQALLEKSFMDMRQRIASVRHIGASMVLSVPSGGQQPETPTGAAKPSENANQPLADALSKLEQSLLHGLKSALAHLLQMTAGAELSWVSANGPEFLRRYSSSVREQVFAKFFQRTAEMGERFCTGTGVGGSTSMAASGGGGSLLLTTAKACQNMATSMVGYVMDLCEQQFRVALNYRSTPPPSFASSRQRDKTPAADAGASSVSDLETVLKSMGRKLLEEFVTAEGFGISQMLVKSMETRDWLGGLEPRAIRPVMKRVVEDLTAIDWRVGQLFEEGNRRDRSSESSRRTSALASVSARAAAGAAQSRLLLSQTANGMDSTVAALSKKIWTERIDYLTSVDFTRVSIMTGVIKICLKTFLESARLRTFGKFGLQHVQIDCHYLQLHLWRFVSDENIVSTLLEEILSSATRRCLEPVLMEPSVVDSICERG